ncbi:MAG: protein-L-isoaspartate O-methyltransferase [Spirochaetales bacterium]|nr:protein-L-isoaspartate O-methyltransferase [Spirochaetales bacterium]
MNSCRICGLDVEEGDICQECSSQGNTGPSSSVAMKINKKTLIVFSSLVAVLFLFLFGFFFFNQMLESEGLRGMNTVLENAGAVSVKAGISGNNSKAGNLAVAYDITKQTNRPPIRDLNGYLKWMHENTAEEVDFITARWGLASKYIESKELVGDRVIEAFLLTPREHFVRKPNIARAYDDSWLPIGHGATITDPDVVAMMTTSLEIEPQHRVLEIGTGSGYQSAILSHLSNYVFSIEIIEPLAKETDELYTSLEADYPTYKNIHRKLDDGFYGWEEYAPFDRIIITCGIDHVPPPLIQQLSNDGIIVAPLGPPGRQYIMQMRKEETEDKKIKLTRRDVYSGMSVSFIPFRDKKGQAY